MESNVLNNKTDGVTSITITIRKDKECEILALATIITELGKHKIFILFYE